MVSLGIWLCVQQKLLLPYLCSYTDVLMEGRTHKVDDALLAPILLHAATHIVRARVAVIKHNKKLRTVQAMEKASDDDDDDDNENDNEEDEQPEKEGGAAQETKDDSNAENEAEGDNESEDERRKNGVVDTLDVSDDEGDEDRYRDQGFTRPRLLILCPMRKAALSVRVSCPRDANDTAAATVAHTFILSAQLVEQLLETFGPLTAVSGLERFREDFGAGDEEDEVGTKEANGADGESQHSDDDEDDDKGEAKDDTGRLGGTACSSLGFQRRIS